MQALSVALSLLLTKKSQAISLFATVVALANAQRTTGVSLSDELAKQANDPALAGAVYVLTNPSMPNMVKIGITHLTVAQRMSELDKTATPTPFQCFYAAHVKDAARVESALHAAFDSVRVRPAREFFRVKPQQVKAVLELLALEDVTPERSQ